MKSNAKCTRPQIVAFAIGMSLLSACATANSDRVVGVCPPVVEYSYAEQTRAADEIEALPKGAFLTEWMADYNMLREQVRICGA